MSALHVVFKVAASEYVLPVSDVVHMESFSGATEVPGTPDYVAGLVQTRGRVVPVVDLRARFGLPEVPQTLDSRIVVVQSGDRIVGLLCDSAREVVTVPAEQFRPPPEIVAQQAAGYVKAVAQAGTRLFMLIDFKKVIGEEVSGGQ